MTKRLLVVLWVSWSFLSVAWAQEPECGIEDLGSGRATYCIQKPDPDSNNGNVIYYLHGLGGDVMQAFSQGLTADATSATVIAVSYGPLWFFAPEGNPAPGSETMKSFVDELMPRLEGRLSEPVSPSNRMVVGASMGGFNATQLYEQHPDQFTRIALLCPGLSEVSPYASPEEVLAYIQRTGADPATVARAVGVGRLAFPSEESWDGATPLNPDNLARVGPQSPPVYISIGRQDEWGFYEGTEAFVEQLQGLGVTDLQWYPVDGPHCSFDREALEGFLKG